MASGYLKHQHSSQFMPFFSLETKETFKGMGVEFKVIELDKVDNGSDIQAELEKMTGQRTVPNVYVSGQHIGGNDATQAAKANGTLEKLLSS
jgi:glutaredoxin 3